jgi:hypothetical protein
VQKANGGSMDGVGSWSNRNWKLEFDASDTGTKHLILTASKAAASLAQRTLSITVGSAAEYPRRIDVSSSVVGESMSNGTDRLAQYVRESRCRRDCLSQH